MPLSSNRIISYLSWLGVIAAFSALAVYAYIGAFTRYMADDYCLLVNLQSGNVFAASWSKYLFTSNRFSNLFVIGLWELFPNNIAFVPALHILLWVGGLLWLFHELNRLFDLKLKFPLLLLAAELPVLFSFYTTPNIFQALYWRPGQVTYLTPLVLFTFAAAWLTRIVRTPSMKNLIWQAPVLALIAFFIGGLSETAGALHIAILSLAVLFVLLFDKSRRRKPALTLLLALLVGALAAMLAMLLSPANTMRFRPDAQTPGALIVLSRSLQYTYAFLLIAFRVTPTPSILILTVSLLISYLLFEKNGGGKFNPRFAWTFALIPVIAYGLIFASFAPSAYGQSYPVERVRFPAHFVLNLALISFGACAGYVLSFVKFPSIARYFAAAVTLLAMLYPVWMIQKPMQTYEDRRLFAKRWDEREVMIHDLVRSGGTEIVIPALDGYQGTKELDIRPYFWVNQCAARYYGADTITAISVEEEDVLDFFSE